MKDEVMRIFISDLKILPIIEKAYKKTLQEIEEIEYRLQGVYGINPAKVIIHNNTHNDIRLDLILEKNKKEDYAKSLKDRIDRTYYILNVCPDAFRSILIDIYVKKVNTAQVAESHYMSESTLRRRIIAELQGVEIGF